MNLTQGIVYYLFSFILTTSFVLCGCFIGVSLRKMKNARLAAAEGQAEEKEGLE